MNLTLFISHLLGFDYADLSAFIESFTFIART